MIRICPALCEARQSGEERNIKESRELRASGDSLFAMGHSLCEEGGIGQKDSRSHNVCWTTLLQVQGAEKGCLWKMWIIPAF